MSKQISDAPLLEAEKPQGQRKKFPKTLMSILQQYSQTYKWFRKCGLHTEATEEYKNKVSTSNYFLGSQSGRELNKESKAARTRKKKKEKRLMVRVVGDI